MVRERERERRAWLRWVWEIVKEALCQKLLTYRLPPPLFHPNKFSGLTVVVTGATSGIGLHTARALAMAGAHVIMACRNVKAGIEIARAWGEETARDSNSPPRVEVLPLDLLSISSVRQFAELWEKREKPLHVLINNAGIFLMREPQKFSGDGIEQHMQVNHIAPALLTLLLLPSLLRAPSSRIINVSSLGHHCALVDPLRWKSRVEEDKYNDKRSYGESKLAQLMFLKTLASKLVERKVTSIHCIAVSPGIVNTKMVRQIPIADWKLFWMLDPAQGARSVLFCATSDEVEDNIDDTGFGYYSYNCKSAKVSPEAMDVDACTDVWRKTMEILDMDVDCLTLIRHG